MTEITISSRIPMLLEKELEEYMKAEHLERSVAIRKLLYESLQKWREEYAIKLLTEGKTTLSRAAEIAGMDIWEFTAKVKESKKIWVKDDVISKDIGEFYG